MVQIQKNVVFLLSVLLLLQNGAFGMIKGDEGGLFSWFFKKKKINPNQKTLDFKMKDMKKLALTKKQDLENWVILEDEPSEEETSVSLNPSKKDFEMKPMMHIDNINDKDLTTWEIVDTHTSKKYDENSLIYSNSPDKINSYRVQKIVELFDDF